MFTPIVDGRRATESELNSTVALFYTDYGTSDCTGTLIAPDVVLTAAHCIGDYDFGEPLPPHSILVLSGQLDASQPASGSAYRVSQVIPHQSYDPRAMLDPDPDGLAIWHDIGILILEEPIHTQRPSPIPSVEEFDEWVPRGTQLVISGYGVTETSSEDGGVLYIAETPFQVRNSHEVLAGGAGFPDTCFGDSGGPLYLPIDGGHALLGVTSRAADLERDECGLGGVYTWATAYRDWIEMRSGGRWVPDQWWPEPARDGGSATSCRCNVGWRSSSRAWPLALMLLFFVFYRFRWTSRT